MTGDVMGDLNSKRAKIAGVETVAGGKQRVRAMVPQAEVARYAIDLRSITGGRGAFTMKVSHYEEVPTHLADKIVLESQKAKEEAHKK
jgi:elongation factor G